MKMVSWLELKWESLTLEILWSQMNEKRGSELWILSDDVEEDVESAIWRYRMSGLIDYSNDGI